MILTTERFIIRDFVESDWHDVYQYSSDPEVVRFLPFAVNTEEQTREYIQRCITFAQERPRTVYSLGG